MSRAIIPLLVAAAAALQGCVPVVIGAGGAAAYSSLEDRRTAGTQIDDEAIEVRASNRVSDRFGGAVHVNVTSYNRIALLSGEVPDERAKAEAEKGSATSRPPPATAERWTSSPLPTPTKS